MSVLDYEHQTPAETYQEPEPDLEDPDPSPQEEPSSWTVESDAIPPGIMIRYGEEGAEDVIEANYDGQVMFEFDIDELSEENDYPVILGAGRPFHWLKDMDFFPEEVKKAHFQQGFKDVFQTICYINPNVKEITVAIRDSYLRKIAYESGRPEAWERAIITAGEVPLGNIDGQETDNGNQFEIVFSRPLHINAQAAIDAFLEEVLPEAANQA